MTGNRPLSNLFDSKLFQLKTIKYHVFEIVDEIAK